MAVFKLVQVAFNCFSCVSQFRESVLTYPNSFGAEAFFKSYSPNYFAVFFVLDELKAPTSSERISSKSLFDAHSFGVVVADCPAV
jgi:hypothetical protein